MRPIRQPAILEANTVTGPAKNLLQFAGTPVRGKPVRLAETYAAILGPNCGVGTY